MDIKDFLIQINDNLAKIYPEWFSEFKEFEIITNHSPEFFRRVKDGVNLQSCINLDYNPEDRDNGTPQFDLRTSDELIEGFEKLPNSVIKSASEKLRKASQINCTDTLLNPEQIKQIKQAVSKVLKLLDEEKPQKTDSYTWSHQRTIINFIDMVNKKIDKMQDKQKGASRNSFTY
ncbi:hypothetical protein [Legionella gresilensis]|uniref:hypothetical protein n=1 Tax=Legionella gresilensis TaxID=91823 RepID=UPI00104195A1|nr:hypothetical protein [Legionella gresilensis]